jgi:hypothetical protein
MGIMQDIHRFRGTITSGYNPHRFVELYGGEVVEVSQYEPDPQSYRGKFYYNARTNQLYKKLFIGRIYAYWKSISEIS